MLKSYDALVIGAGVSGMTSALLLAARGKRVAVLEAGRTLSPLMQGFDRGGAHFETGFHYAANMEQGGFGPYIFKKLGLNLKGYPLLQNGYDEIHLPSGKVFQMAYGRENLEKNLVSFWPEETEAIVSFLDKVQAQTRASAFLNMHKNEHADFNAVVDVGDTLQTVLDAHFKSAELKAVFAASTFLHGTPPDKISFSQHACIAGCLYEGAYGIEGGGRAITAAYEAALKEAGVDVFLNCPVRKLEERGAKKIINDEFECDICISSIHPKEFLKIAPANVYRESYKARVNALEETPPFFTLYGVLDGEYTPKSNIFYLRELDINKVFSGESKEKSYYINFSPAKPQAVSVICFCDDDWPRGAGYKAKKEAYAAQVERDVRALLRGVKYVAASTPATSVSYMGYASSYGVMHDVNKTKILPMTKIKGVYLTGQSVVAPGLFGTIITSLLVDKILEKSL